MEKELKTVLKDVFGGSSSDSSDAEEQLEEFDSQTWEKIPEISGLCLCRDFLSPPKQSSLLSNIQKEGWFTEISSNQAMRFGNLPAWAIELSDFIREVVGFSDLSDDKESCYFPSELLWREPLFDQLIVNKYEPGEGICPHVDLMRFADGIAIISLESSVVMHFSKAKGEMHDHEKVAIHLTPGSLVLMWGEARYLWKHEINRKPGFQLWEGHSIDQKRRVSITLRKLCQTEENTTSHVN